MTTPVAASERHEPAFNSPWPVLLLIAAVLLSHVLSNLGYIHKERLILFEHDLNQGRWIGLIGHMFAHQGWLHAAMNCAFILAFGTPVARYLGVGVRGACIFLLFFLTCGVLAALAYAGALGLLPRGMGFPGEWGLLGASGAASGLMGGAIRLVSGSGLPGPLGSRSVVRMTLSWIVLNTVMGLSGLTPGAVGIPVAWQAHIFGYLAGVMLIAPFGVLAGAPRAAPNEMA